MRMGMLRHSSAPSRYSPRRASKHIYFLGDAVGYVPSAAVLDSLARLGSKVQCIRGNHEAMLLEGQSDPRANVFISWRPSAGV
jgi:hypothetical protein